jgi:hypothetical protein
MSGITEGDNATEPYLGPEGQRAEHRFRKRVTEYSSDDGVRWVRGSTKRQNMRPRAIWPPRAGLRRAHPRPAPVLGTRIRL